MMSGTGSRPLLSLFCSVLLLSAVCFLFVAFTSDDDTLRGRIASVFWERDFSDDGSNATDQLWPPHDVFQLHPAVTVSPALLSDYTKFNQFTINPEPCSQTSAPFLLLIIFTRPQAFERRKTIRETYGSVRLHCPGKMRILFIVGQVSDTTVQALLVKEAAETKDIIQSSAFTDGYGEAARKGVALLHWSVQNCPQAQFTAKADDDCWINLPRYLDILKAQRDNKKILGLLWPKGAVVIRDSANKWSVPLADYPEDRFPPYVSGILYAFHKDILAPVTQAVTKSKYLWHDDVFLTGIAAKEAGVGHTAVAGYDTRGDSWRKPCSKRSMLAIHYVDDAKMKTLWNDSCHSYKLAC
ncbi:putative Beta-1,3-galactosyltransferase 1 [Hypsibius exemplaris]|uniref:Hexosyltransferase n=1 Tax=Hypsibius exemplaris TaxID=2072580 RepID=A0A1W0WVQ3_HYPEX|nr:putative Beta-1,3-galactosyltransferase 1 [Hypsibius exemplaris]